MTLVAKYPLILFAPEGSQRTCLLVPKPYLAPRVQGNFCRADGLKQQKNSSPFEFLDFPFWLGELDFWSRRGTVLILFWSHRRGRAIRANLRKCFDRPTMEGVSCHPCAMPQIKEDLLARVEMLECAGKELAGEVC